MRVGVRGTLSMVLRKVLIIFILIQEQYASNLFSIKYVPGNSVDKDQPTTGHIQLAGTSSAAGGRAQDTRNNLFELHSTRTMQCGRKELAKTDRVIDARFRYIHQDKPQALLTTASTSWSAPVLYQKGCQPGRRQPPGILEHRHLY